MWWRQGQVSESPLLAQGLKLVSLRAQVSPLALGKELVRLQEGSTSLGSQLELELMSVGKQRRFARQGIANFRSRSQQADSVH